MSLHVDVHVTMQGLTFDRSPYSTFLIQLFAALAELESNHASERIRAGLQAARDKGTKPGRKVDDRKRSKVQRWTNAGVSVTVQAKRLGCTPQAVYALLKRSGIEATPRRIRKAS